MQLLVKATFAVCVVAMAQSALAQPQASRRRGPPPKAQTQPAPPAQAKSNANNKQLCESRQAILEREQRQLERFQADAAGIDAEMAELRRRLAELEREKAQTDRSVATLTGRINNLEQVIKSDCQDGRCDQMYTSVTALDNRTSEIEKQMSQVGKDIATSRVETSKLERQIEPLRKEYASKSCNNLVPGSTSQTTINRCSTIFSEWNRLQMALNGQNRRLGDLRRLYQQLYNELNNVGQRAESYASFITTQCKDKGRKPHKMRNYATVRSNAQKMGRELDDLINTVARLRGIHISVQAN